MENPTIPVQSDEKKVGDALFVDGAAESRSEEEGLFDKRRIGQIDLQDKINLEIRLAQVLRGQQILRTAIDDMVNSTAWRMTGPVRYLVSNIRKIGRTLKSRGKSPVRIPKEEKDLPDEKLIGKSKPYEKTHLEIRLARAWSEHQRLSNEVDEIVHSTTWRMTASVRDLLLGLKRNYRYRKLTGTTANLLKVSGSYIREMINRPPFQQIKNQVLYLADTFFREAGAGRNMISMRQLAANRYDASACNIRQAPLGKYPCIDIGVVTFNNRKWLPIFMNSLLAQRYPLEKIALIIVDHGSRDGTRDAWQELENKYNSRFRRFVILQQENLGFGGGQNLAFRHSTARYFLVSNVDLEFEPDALTEIVATATREGAALGSLELRQKPYEHPKYYDPITFETAWSAHSCVLFNSDAFRTVGGYETRIFMYGEDTELSYRLRDNGFSVKYCPKAVVWHYYFQDQNPEHLKPLQFKGNTIANSFVRIRYGAWADILRIPGMYLSLIRSRFRLREPLKEVAESFGTVLRNLPYFLVTRKQSELVFPFHDWDFERRREGAFYRQLRSPQKVLPMVTVIIRACAGREPYLREALCSVATQTYSNIELVILEQGGATATPLAAQLRSQYSLSVRHLALPPLGKSAAANQGLTVAQGDYLMFLDDDALLFSDHVEILVNGLLNEPQRDAAYSLSMEIKSIGVGNSRCPYYEVEYVSPESLRQPFDRPELLNRNFIPIQSVLFRRSLYQRYGGFDENLRDSADWDLWLRYSHRNDFLFIEKTTSLFRSPYHPGKGQERKRSGYGGEESIRLKHETLGFSQRT